MCLVPVILIVGFIPASGAWWYITSTICAALFIGASVTDMLDGKIARKNNLVTDFGKFMDPVADKFMVIGTLLCITVANEALRPYMAWLTAIVIFRELGITSMRLVVANSGVVVPANWLGKCKTMAQAISICVFLMEAVLCQYTHWILSYIGIVVTAVLTVWSGVEYFTAYWKYIDPEK